jgi:putative SOS response-associated peptidase YedK
MCGRYRLGRGREAFKKYFGTEDDDLDWSPRYNIAPTQVVPIVRQHAREPKRTLASMRWGLIPSWATDLSIGAKLINARAETAAEKPAFRDALQRRRCLIPADGFFEWKKLGKGTQPYCFTLVDDSVFAFAGIWDRWRDPDKQWIETCSILTTTPNAVMAHVHDRMPVILRPDDYDLWLDPGFTKLEGLLELMKPYDARLMKKHPVSTRVGDPKNDDEQCAAKIELTMEQTQGSLFG